MADSYAIESILAADCGASTTRVFLLDVVDEQYRFVAGGESPTTVGAPGNDIVIGVIQAIRQLESITGKRFLDDELKLIRPERSDGSGVDAFVATVSAGPPLRVVLAGLVPEMSVTSAKKALSWVPALLEGVISLGGDSDPAEQIDRIRQAAPDVVVMVGGTEGGAVRAIGALADAVALAGKLLERERRPDLVYAGNVNARALLAEKVAGVINFHPVDNVRPRLDVEQAGPLVEELETLYADRKMARLPGFGRLSAWSPISVAPGQRAFGQIVQFVADQYGLNVLGVDVGSSQTVLASVLNGEFVLTVG
ncbi:MAG: glutamate mutase L, partial [Anaerolineae bacterium]